MKFFIIGALYGPILLAILGGYLRYRAVAGFQATLKERLDGRAFRARLKQSPFGRQYKLGLAFIIGAPLVTLASLIVLRMVASLAT